MLVGAIADRATSFRIQQRDETTGFGDWYNVSTPAFESGKPPAVPLTEDPNQPLRYTYLLGPLETYNGLVEVFYYQDDTEENETLVGSEIIQLAEGVPVAAAATVTPPTPSTELSLVDIGDHRTWYIHDCRGGVSTRVLTVPEGSAEWLAMEFTDVLDDTDSIETVVSAVDLNSNVSVASHKVGANRREAHVSLSGYQSGRESKIKVTATTAQGQTIVGTGVLQVD